jgi:hypothetical protein
MQVLFLRNECLPGALCTYQCKPRGGRGGSRGDQSDHATKVKIGQKIVKLK